MTSKEGVYGNNLFAEFMGAKIGKGGTKRFPVYTRVPVTHNGVTLTWTFSSKDFRYHLSWDWIMPVVRKFDCLTENKEIKTSDDFEFWCNKIDDTVTRTYEIEAVFKIMVEAIEWYNTIKAHKGLPV